MKKSNEASGVSLAINQTMHAIQNGLILFEKSKQKEFTIKVVNTLEEREAVFNLGYGTYLEKGYINHNSNEWLIEYYDTNSDTVILIVQDKHKNIVGSVTLVFDGVAKLPAEKIYSEELKLLRKSNQKIAELSRLIISREYRNSKEILILLFNYAAIYIRHVKAYDGLIVQVNPRHKNYYKALLYFDEVGAEKPCPSVQNAPANLLYLSSNKYQAELNRFIKIQNNDKQEHSLYQFFLNVEQENLVAYYLEKQVKPMTVEEKIYFGFSNSEICQAVCQ